MWIVRLALRRPYSFLVMALLMVVLGAGAIFQMRKDLFPTINIPVVSVIRAHTGMPPQEMADRITTIHERALSTTVNDIEHIESNSYPGVSVIRVFFRRASRSKAASRRCRRPSCGRRRRASSCPTSFSTTLPACPFRSWA